MLLTNSVLNIGRGLFLQRGYLSNVCVRFFMYLLHSQIDMGGGFIVILYRFLGALSCFSQFPTARRIPNTRSDTSTVMPMWILCLSWVLRPLNINVEFIRLASNQILVLIQSAHTSFTSITGLLVFLLATLQELNALYIRGLRLTLSISLLIVLIFFLLICLSNFSIVIFLRS